MATLVSTLITQIRSHLSAETDDYWTDEELASHIDRGARDLWRKLNDEYEEYFVTIDDTHVTLPANASQLAGVPADVFRIVTIEPRVVGEASPNLSLVFKQRRYNHPDFQQARAGNVGSPNNKVLFYALMTQGAPVAAPIILVAPQVSVAVNIRLVYNQTLVLITKDSTNPIPGESDNALIAWAVAYARAKESLEGQRAPDPEWIAVYATEKQNLVAQMTPRSIQEPDVVMGMFEDGSGW